MSHCSFGPLNKGFHHWTFDFAGPSLLVLALCPGCGAVITSLLGTTGDEECLVCAKCAKHINFGFVGLSDHVVHHVRKIEAKRKRLIKVDDTAVWTFGRDLIDQYDKRYIWDTVNGPEIGDLAEQLCGDRIPDTDFYFLTKNWKEELRELIRREAVRRRVYERRRQAARRILARVEEKKRQIAKHARIHGVSK